MTIGYRSERQTLSVEETARLLGIGRASAYKAVRRGEIPAVRIGRRWLVSSAALNEMLRVTDRGTAR